MGGASNAKSGRRKFIVIPLVVIAVGAVVVLLAPAAQLISWQVDPKLSVSALTSFRSQQSKIPGKTVDQCVNEWVDESRKSGALLRLVGWSIKPIKFNKSKVTFDFSYEDKEGVIIAEWLADVDDNVFVPKNDLAAEVYGKTH